MGERKAKTAREKWTRHLHGEPLVNSRPHGGNKKGYLRARKERGTKNNHLEKKSRHGVSKAILSCGKNGEKKVAFPGGY